MFKTYNTFGDLFWSAAGSRRAIGGARICETNLLVFVIASICISHFITRNQISDDVREI